MASKSITAALFVILAISILTGCTITGHITNIPENRTVSVVTFYGQGCPHCSKLHLFLEDLKKETGYIDVREYEIYFNNENRDLLFKMAGIYDAEVGGVPMVFVNNRVFSGFTDSLGKSIKREIEECYKTGNCIDPFVKLEKGLFDNRTIEISGEASPAESPEKTLLKQRLTLPAVLTAAAVDAINPCAFAVLIILLTTILAAGNKKKALWAGIAFTISIYVSYFLMGLGLYSAVQASGFTHTFYAIVAVLAMLVGLFNLKDYLWYGKWFIMEVPMSWRPKLKAVLKGVTSVPGAFLIGFVVSLFLLPCTSGPYIVILGLLSQVATRNYAIALLLLYNIIFVLPMLIITLAVYFGFTTTEKAEEWRQKRLETLHLIAGIIMLLLGIGMFIAMWAGIV